METIKPWYVSRTIWASVVMVVATLAGVLGFQIEEADTDAMVDAVLQAVAALAGIAAIFGRIAARSRIG